MGICINCVGLGYCPNRFVSLVPKTELENPEFIRDLRWKAHSLEIDDEKWIEHLKDLYRDYGGWVAGSKGQEIFLDMSEFERPSIREWFRDFCCTPCPEKVIPRVRCEARKRVRILATILKAHYPIEAMMWGVRGANDNHQG